jgi:hypothetical protein
VQNWVRAEIAPKTKATANDIHATVLAKLLAVLILSLYET